MREGSDRAVPTSRRTARTPTRRLRLANGDLPAFDAIPAGGRRPLQLGAGHQQRPAMTMLDHLPSWSWPPSTQERRSVHPSSTRGDSTAGFRSRTGTFLDAALSPSGPPRGASRPIRRNPAGGARKAGLPPSPADPAVQMRCTNRIGRLSRSLHSRARCDTSERPMIHRVVQGFVSPPGAIRGPSRRASPQARGTATV